MCGRFTLDIDERFYPRFRLSGNVINQLSDWQARYNIAPSQNSIVILPDSLEGNSAEQMRWGLVPFWSKDTQIGNKMINAKAETLLEKPSFRNAVKSKRCIVPVNGFYEWKEESVGKQPHYLYSESEKYLALAGLYEIWTDPTTNKELHTFTIVTTQPNKSMVDIHDRMPLILDESDIESAWLNPETKLENIQKILAAIPQIQLASFPVGKKVNSPANEGPGLLARI